MTKSAREPLRRSWGAALITLLVGATSAVNAEPMHVFVQSGSDGQGLLFRWRDSCFALTAGHVLQNSMDATLVGGANREIRGAGKLTARFGERDDDDLALLRVTGTLSSAQHCDTDLESLKVDTEAANKGAGSGSLAYVDREGQLTRLDLLVKSPRDGLVLVEPRQAGEGEALLEGRSGSLVYLGNRPLGILLHKWADDPGKGVVMAMNHAIARIVGYFNNPVPLGTGGSNTSGTAEPAAEPGNLLDPALGAEIIEWSTLPARPENGPARLLEAHGAQAWVGRLGRDGAPVELDFRLGGSTTPVLGRVEIELPSGPGAPPVAQWASEVEVLTSISGARGSWNTFGTPAILHQDELRKSVTSGLRPKARFLKLRIYRNRGDPSWISLRRLRAFAP